MDTREKNVKTHRARIPILLILPAVLACSLLSIPLADAGSTDIGQGIRNQSDDDWMAGMGFAMCLALTGGLFVLQIVIAVWVYRDAEERGENAVIWLLIVLVGGIIGLIVYLVVRKDARLGEIPTISPGDPFSSRSRQPVYPGYPPYQPGYPPQGPYGYQPPGYQTGPSQYPQQYPPPPEEHNQPQQTPGYQQPSEQQSHYQSQQSFQHQQPSQSSVPSSRQGGRERDDQPPNE